MNFRSNFQPKEFSTRTFGSRNLRPGLSVQGIFGADFRPKEVSARTFGPTKFFLMVKLKHPHSHIHLVLNRKSGVKFRPPNKRNEQTLIDSISSFIVSCKSCCVRQSSNVT